MARAALQCLQEGTCEVVEVLETEGEKWIKLRQVVALREHDQLNEDYQVVEVAARVEDLTAWPLGTASGQSLPRLHHYHTSGQAGASSAPGDPRVQAAGQLIEAAHVEALMQAVPERDHDSWPPRRSIAT